MIESIFSLNTHEEMMMMEYERIYNANVLYLELAVLDTLLLINECKGECVSFIGMVEHPLPK